MFSVNPLGHQFLFSPLLSVLTVMGIHAFPDTFSFQISILVYCINYFIWRCDEISGRRFSREQRLVLAHSLQGTIHHGEKSWLPGQFQPWLWEFVAQLLVCLGGPGGREMGPVGGFHSQSSPPGDSLWFARPHVLKVLEPQNCWGAKSQTQMHGGGAFHFQALTETCEIGGPAVLSCAHDICMGGCQHICSPTVLSNVVFRASYLPQGDTEGSRDGSGGTDLQDLVKGAKHPDGHVRVKMRLQRAHSTGSATFMEYGNCQRQEESKYHSDAEVLKCNFVLNLYSSAVFPSEGICVPRGMNVRKIRRFLFQVLPKYEMTTQDQSPN